MTDAWPDPALPPSVEMTQTLAALDQARQDTALDAATRALLDRAHAALAAAIDDTESERLRYTALFDAVPDPVSILDWDGTVLDLNKAGMAAYQRPREEIVGQPIEVLNPDLPPDHMVPVWEALGRGETYAVEVANMRGDGRRFPVEVHSAGFDYRGRKCIVAVARDLSNRWQAETRYRLLFQVASEAVLILDATSEKLEEANPAAFKLLGEKARIAGWTFIESLDSLSVAGVQQLFAALRRNAFAIRATPTCRCRQEVRLSASGSDSGTRTRTGFDPASSRQKLPR